MPRKEQLEDDGDLLQAFVRFDVSADEAAARNAEVGLLLQYITEARHLLLAIHLMKLLWLLSGEEIVRRSESSLGRELVATSLIAARLGLLLILQTVVESDVYLQFADLFWQRLAALIGQFAIQCALSGPKIVLIAAGA